MTATQLATPLAAVLVWAAALIFVAIDRRRFTTTYPATRDGLLNRRYLPATAAISTGATLAAVLLAPPAAVPAWLIVTTMGTHCVTTDALTGYVPARWCHLAWASLAITTIATAIAGHPEVAIRTTIAAAGTAALFWLIWRISRGGIGFGDVRYAPLPAAATAAVSTITWTIGLTAGTIIGAAVALTLARKFPATPYTPSLWVGALAALAVWRLW